MNIFDGIEKVKSALSTRDQIAELSHFHLKDGEVLATDGAMTASCPIDESLEHVVPAEEILKAMEILGRDAIYTWSDDTLVIKKGRRKITIRLLQSDQVDFIQSVTTKIPVPEDFIARLKLIVPFISEDASRPWALTAWLHTLANGKPVWTATNNICVCEVDATKEDPTSLRNIDCQIPNFAIDYVVKRNKGLTHIGVAENRVTFFFDDGSKMTSQLFVVKMPEQVSRILDQQGDMQQDAFPLSGEWMDAYMSVTELKPDIIMLSGEKMTATKRQATMEAELGTCVPRDQKQSSSVWSPKFLTPVIQAATHIDFANYPGAASFRGDGLRGVIVGKVL